MRFDALQPGERETHKGCVYTQNIAMQAGLKHDVLSTVCFAETGKRL